MVVFIDDYSLKCAAIVMENLEFWGRRNGGANQRIMQTFVCISHGKLYIWYGVQADAHLESVKWLRERKRSMNAAPGSNVQSPPVPWCQTAACPATLAAV